jgi:SanA protein
MKTRIQGIGNWLRCNRRRLVVLTAVVVLSGLSAVAVTDQLCKRAAQGRIYRSVENVPQNDVALVLGTAKKTAHGSANLHFNQRIQAAAALYHSGKVRHLLVSGDNHTAGYDEPTDMRDALVTAGVPAAAITRDYAGFRTLDSVVRAKLVFGLSRFTIVSEEFHCPRALWIARQNGIEAVAFAAPDLRSARWTLGVEAREYLARTWCGVDLYLLHRGPKFPGPREPILLTSSSH